MPRYLDPKNDLVFKRVFGEHPDILRAFLNAVLPLGPDEKIVSLAYLPPESVPPIPLLKYTIVDVRCHDVLGRQFIVEMQMQWTTDFLQRVLFSAGRAFVNQLEIGEDYKLLQPVFGLSVVNDIFLPTKTEFYHHYKMVNIKDVTQEIKGLQLVFIELPKFVKSQKGLDPDLVGWLRYLQETGKPNEHPEDLSVLGAEMQEALHLAEAAAYSRAEMEAYYRYWDGVSTAKTLISGKLAEGRALGRAEGMAEGIQVGLERALEKQLKQNVGLSTTMEPWCHRNRAGSGSSALAMISWSFG